nr:integrase, catalytic region, zinc finger, CCHC-type, peptidase aspartic, catalytic [Tanacetum cinerariifolium]
MTMLNNKCRTSFVKPEYLKKGKQVNPRLYDIGCYNDNLALMLSPESDEVIRLEKESRSKLKRSRVSHITVQKEKKSFNKQPTLLEKRLDESIPLGKKCKSYLELFNFMIPATTIANVVEMCKKSITKSTYFGYLDPFIKNTIEQNFSPEIERVLTGLNQFQRFLKEEMFADLRYFNSLESEVDSLRSQLETQKTQFSNEIDRLSREYYFADHMNAILGVYTELDEVTNLQCDYLELLQKCECLETELSKSKMMSKSFKSVQKHAINLELELQQCKEKFSNEIDRLSREYYYADHMNAILGVIPITSVSRPQLKSNPMGDRVMHNNSQGKKKEVEDHRRSVKLSKNKTFVTSCNDSFNAKTLNVKSVSAMCDKCVLIDKHDMKQYERVSKTYSWWYPKFTPSVYIWKPKSKKENVNPNVSMPLGNTSRTANVLDTMTSRSSIVSNTPLSSNSFAAHRERSIHRTVKFGNDQIAPILGYGDLVQEAVMIKRVYYVEGLNHNLFSISQFCDADLVVAFRKSTCFIRDLKGNDLLT